MSRASAPVRFAIHNPFHPDAPWAERELALRIGFAMDALGWDHQIVHDTDALEKFQPDAALCLHPQHVPKMSAVSSLACHWNPVQMFRHKPLMWQNSLTHDAFLVGSPALAEQLKREVGGDGVPVPMVPFYPSSQGWALSPRLRADSRLFYIGSNWDGQRYPMLLGKLSNEGVLALHGQADRWQHLQASFVRSLPFDGKSVIEQANVWGMGLCLHLPAHFEAGIPNMRVFELCAAGALIISDRHPFVLENFGETVLYVDLTQGEEKVAEQILEHVRSARANPEKGREMARAAQEIFLKRFSLECLLAPMPDLVRSLSSNGRPVENRETVCAILPTGAASREDIADRLRSIVDQTLPVTEIVLCGHGAAAFMADHPSVKSVSVKTAELGPDASHVAILRAGVEASSSAWLIFLQAGSRIFPNHVQNLDYGRLANPLAKVLTSNVLMPGPVIADGADSRVRMIHPFLDWCLANRERPGLAGMMAKRDCVLETLGRIGADAFSGEHLGMALASVNLTGHSTRTGVRLTQRDVQAAAEQHEAPWTGYSDLDAGCVRDIARLRRAADFANLPADRPCYLYGASRGGELLFAALSQWTHVHVAGFLDGRGHGEKNGLPVRNPNDLTQDEISNSIIIFANQYVSSCWKTLQDSFPQIFSSLTLFNGYPYIYDICEYEGKLSIRN